LSGLIYVPRKEMAMKVRVGLVTLLAFIGLWIGFGRAQAQPADQHAAEQHEGAAPAEGEHHEAAAPADGEHHEAEPASKPAEHHDEAAPVAHDEHHAAAPAAPAAPAAHDEHHDTAAAESSELVDDDGIPTKEFDLDGTGKDDPQLKKEYDEAFAGISETIDTDAVDKELEERAAKGESLMPSVTVEQFRKAVQMAKKVVLAKMEKKIEAGIEKKMSRFSLGVFILSLCGILFLLIPFVVGKKYPGKQGVLFKYSALAGVTFFVTVNLFGGVLMSMRVVLGHLGKFANPSLAIAAATFDTLDKNAEGYAVLGKEIFLPTVESLRGDSDEQPVAVLLENGKKVIKDATVFVSIAKMVKKIDLIFKLLPILLFGMSMILFGLAIKPTIVEIVKLPMRAAAGDAGVGRATTKRALGRVFGELKAAACTLGVLAVITFVSAFTLGEVVGPVLDDLVGYFFFAVLYLVNIEGASSGLVFVGLFGVTLFLVINLATLILSTVFFLGKTQKIFQARFNDGTPIRTHARFFKWGVPAILFVQLFPWIYGIISDVALEKIYGAFMGDDLAAWSWGKIFLVAPVVLIVGFGILFWAARGVKAIKFLATYKVKAVPPVRPSAPSQPAEAV
jgi:hypothetical protein